MGHVHRLRRCSNIKTAAFYSKRSLLRNCIIWCSMFQMVGDKNDLKFLSTPFILFLDTILEGVPTNWISSIN